VTPPDIVGLASGAAFILEVVSCGVRSEMTCFWRASAELSFRIDRYLGPPEIDSHKPTYRY
jgi:hypothetical protein